jgi:hypothetical protein
MGAKLLEFGAMDRPKPHAVVGFVLGAFSELSNSCYSLCTANARMGASRVESFWKMLPKHALALCKQKILRFWGLTAQRGVMDRFQDLVLSPGDPTAATREPGSASHEHHTVFFQTLSVAPLKLLVSTGGVASASKRSFLFSGSTCCVSTSFLLRRARKSTLRRLPTDGQTS